MSGHVYLIRNGDLYKIGTSSNLESTLKSLNPDEIIEKIKLDKPIPFEVRLLRRYKSKRIPDSKYFRLTKDEVTDCKLQMTNKRKIPLTIADELIIGFNATLFIFLISLLGINSFSNSIFFSISIAMSISSIPMMLLAVLGNIGGYDNNDLPLFHSLGNRFKSLLIVISINSISYLIYLLGNHSS